jgi:hypothetical protein
VAVQVRVYGTPTSSVPGKEHVVRDGPANTVPLIAADCAVVGVDALSCNCNWKLKGPVVAKTPLTEPVPLFCANDAGSDPGGVIGILDHVNGGTPPVVLHVTEYVSPTSVVPNAVQVRLGAATIVPVNVFCAGWGALAVSVRRRV